MNQQRHRKQPQFASPVPGCQGSRTTAAAIVADLAFAHRVRRLHARGPRIVAELLAEIAADRALGTYIDSLLDDFLALSDTDLDMTGGRKLPQIPIHEVQR